MSRPAIQKSRRGCCETPSRRRTCGPSHLAGFSGIPHDIVAAGRSCVFVAASRLGWCSGRQRGSGLGPQSLRRASLPVRGDVGESRPDLLGDHAEHANLHGARGHDVERPLRAAEGGFRLRGMGTLRGLPPSGTSGQRHGKDPDARPGCDSGQTAGRTTENSARAPVRALQPRSTTKTSPGRPLVAARAGSQALMQPMMLTDWSAHTPPEIRKSSGFRPAPS